MKWLVLMLFVAALVADAYIYRGFIVRRFKRVGVRAAYLVFAALTDGVALTALMLYGAAADRGSAGVITVMWLVWVFFLVLVPKILFAVGGVLDRLARLAVRRRVTIFRWTGAAVAAAVMATMVCGATVGRTKLRVEEVEVCSDRVPAAFDGYRIVQFSDIHIGTMLRPEKQLARLVDKINALGGDLVVNTGDLVNLKQEELTAEVMDILATIDTDYGVWSVWGNHDLGFYLKEGGEYSPEENLELLSTKLQLMGWRPLSDSSAWIRHGGDSILLTGLDYPRDPMLNGHNESLAGVDLTAAFEGVEGDPFNVVLAHTPKLWNGIMAIGRGDLTLSGHVHAMQTRLRIFGKTWSPAQYMYDQWSGKYTLGRGEKKSTLYVNDGIGCVGYPMRIGARGEITVITLKRCE